MVNYNVIDPLEAEIINFGKDASEMAREYRSHFDNAWDAEARYRLGLPLFTRLEIPITTKADMLKYAEMIRGLATRMEYEAKNTGQSEHGAALMLRTLVDHANKEMKSRANLLKTGRRRKSNEVD